MFLDLDDDVRHQNHQQHEGTDAHPAHAPVQVRPPSRHVLDVIAEPETQTAVGQSQTSDTETQAQGSQPKSLSPNISSYFSHLFQ